MELVLGSAHSWHHSNSALQGRLLCPESSRVGVLSSVMHFRFDWLWRTDAHEEYEKFMRTNPLILDYERAFQRFDTVAEQVTAMPFVTNIGALAVFTSSLKKSLHDRISAWKLVFCDELHASASATLTSLVDGMRSTLLKLSQTDTVSQRRAIRRLQMHSGP
jgi:hypothetical protein